MSGMASHAATPNEIAPPEMPGAAALQHRQWNSKSLLSRGLAAFEGFLSRSGFDRGPWLTVAFGSGIGLWFAMPSPAWWLGFILLCLATALIVRMLRARFILYPHVNTAFSSIFLLLSAGCSVVWMRSEIVGARPIERPFTQAFTARVMAVEPQPAQQRSRLTLAMREPGTGRAIKVRINLPNELQDTAIPDGSLIRIKARLMPPAPPMLPGAYNFARTAWFSGLSASGTALEPAAILERGGEGGWLAATRASLAAHVSSRVAAPESGIATTLATGDRGGIAETDAQAMRDAGLAHLLAISGLHVSAVIAAAYFLAIRLLALIPALALRLRLPIFAAAFAATAGIGYTLLTGAQVPTVRSCIGAILVLAALVLGREPLSLRMLAVAGFAVMLLWPEAITGPSFQMSFGAVLAIVALTTAGPFRKFLAPREEHAVTRSLRWLAMVFVTGLVIELALMPIGLYHFHRAGVYGALANVVAIPLTTFVVMPLIALGLVLDVVGLGAPAWWAAECAIDLLLTLAHRVASLPGAVTVQPAMGLAPFLLFISGGLWLALWSGRSRMLGFIPASMGTLWLILLQPPDVLISGDGRLVGIVDQSSGERRLMILRDSRSSYVRDNLAETAGMSGEPRLISDWPSANCNRDFCMVPIEREGRTSHLLISRGRDAVPERALAAACDKVDIVIADRWLPASCRPKWFKADRNLLSATGGMTIDLVSGRIRTVAEAQGHHGWWRKNDPTASFILRRPD